MLLLGGPGSLWLPLPLLLRLLQLLFMVMMMQPWWQLLLLLLPAVALLLLLLAMLGLILPLGPGSFWLLMLQTLQLLPLPAICSS